MTQQIKIENMENKKVSKLDELMVLLTDLNAKIESLVMENKCLKEERGFLKETILKLIK